MKKLALLLALLPLSVDAGVLMLSGARGAASSGGGGGGSSALETLAASMTAGTWAQMTPTPSGLAGISQPNSIFNPMGNPDSNTFEDTDRLVYSEIEKKVYFLGCARGFNDPAYGCSDGAGLDASGLVSYDLATNAFSRDNSSGIPVHTNSHAYNYLFMRQADGTLYYCEDIQNGDHVINARSIAGTWSDVAMPAAGTASDQAIGFSEACEYFPERDTFIYVDGGNDNNRPAGGSTFYPKIIERSRTTNNWTGHTVTTNTAQMIGYIENFSRYSPQRQLIYFGGGSPTAGGVGGDKLWMYKSDGSFVQGENAPVGIGTHASSGKQVINPANGNLIIFGNNPKNMYEFNPSTDADGSWTNIGTHPLDTTSTDEMFLVVTSLPSPICVVFALTYDSDDHANELWLYRPTGCP